MRRWLKLVVAMTLAVLMLSLPAAVLAAPPVEKSANPVAFTATVAPLYVTDPGKVRVVHGTVVTVGEKAEGVIASAPGWEDLVGAQVFITHNSITKVDPTIVDPTKPNISGYATGTFLVKKHGAT